MSDGELEAQLTSLRADRPCISDAMKNFLAYLAAQQSTDGKPGPHAHDMPQLMACAKVILKLLNAHELPSPGSWAAEHPQAEDEMGMARIETLSMYKAAYMLNLQVASAPGAKATKLFGRRFLTATGCWDSVHDQAASELAALRFAPALVEAFLRGWSSALGDTPADKEVAELVWAVDFQAVLRARQEARANDVRERRERLDASESEAQQLRDALAGASPADLAADDDDGARIEEIDAQ
jgi:hypothetical protein